jgi:hypothetical protein
MLTDSTGKSFKPAPPKFANELAENSQNDPEPAFLRQYIAGDRALRNRRFGELCKAASIGACAALSIAALPMFFVPFWLAILLITVAGGASIALLGLSLWYLWDAKMADVESRALVAEGEFKIKILSDEEVEQREVERLRGIELRKKAS